MGVPGVLPCPARQVGVTPCRGSVLSAKPREESSRPSSRIVDLKRSRELLGDTMTGSLSLKKKVD